MTIIDPAARSYDAIVASNVHALLRLGLMLTGSASDAEDLVQTVLLKASKHGDRIASMDAPLAYLRRAVVNEHRSLLRHLRRRARTVPFAEEVLDEPAEAALRDIHARDEMWQMLHALPRAQRSVLVLRYYEDLDDGEIAELLGCTASTVRSNAARALAALRRRFGEELSDE